jgi:asparagine synthase (glutamine-hydrolysing)
VELLWSQLHSALASENAKDFWEIASILRRLVVHSVEKSQGDSILLSGGLDTSIVAAVAARSNPKLQAFTVVLKGYPSTDLQYSRLISSHLGLGQDLVEVSLEDVEASLPKVIKVLRSFDPMEIRNSVTVYLGLERAKSRGYSRVLTGDAADELFAGYSFVANLDKERAISKLHYLWKVMHFSSISLAESLGISAQLPFLDKDVKEFATNEIPFEFLVNRDDPDGQVFGKFILRKVFEDLLPQEIVWRKKTPIEFGSGTTFLPQIYSGKISDSEFNEKRRVYFETERLRLRDKEQLHYYEIYRKEVRHATSMFQIKRISALPVESIPSNSSKKRLRKCGGD